METNCTQMKRIRRTTPEHLPTAPTPTAPLTPHSPRTSRGHMTSLPRSAGGKADLIGVGSPACARAFTGGVEAMNLLETATVKASPLTGDELRKLDAYWR